MFPFVLGSCLAVTGGFLAAKGLLKWYRTARTADEQRSPDSQQHEDAAAPVQPPLGRPARALLVVVGLIAVYITLMPVLGYLLSTALFLLGVTTLVDPARWRRNALYAAIFAVVVYFLFTRVLNVLLPAGLLG